MCATTRSNILMEMASMFNDESQPKGNQVAPAEQRQDGQPAKKRTRKNTKARRDKGKKLMTARDCIVLLWIAQ